MEAWVSYSGLGDFEVGEFWVSRIESKLLFDRTKGALHE